MRLGVDPIPRRADPEAISDALYEITTRVPNDVLGVLYKSDLGHAITAASNDSNWKFIYKSLDKYGFEFSWRAKYTAFLVELLLKIGADPTEYAAGRNVAETGDLEALKVFIADSRVDLSRGHLILHGAVYGGNLGNARFLLTTRASVPSDLARTAIDNYDVPILQLLLSSGKVDPSADNNYALNGAVEYGYSDVVSMLLEDDRVVQAVGDWEELLILAVDHGSTSVVPILLKYDEGPYYIGTTLTRACRSDKIEIVRVLLDYVDPLQVNEAFDRILLDCIRIAKNRQNVALVELLERKMTEMGWW